MSLVPDTHGGQTIFSNLCSDCRDKLDMRHFKTKVQDQAIVESGKASDPVYTLIHEYSYKPGVLSTGQSRDCDLCVLVIDDITEAEDTGGPSWEHQWERKWVTGRWFVQCQSTEKELLDLMVLNIKLDDEKYSSMDQNFIIGREHVLFDIRASAGDRAAEYIPSREYDISHGSRANIELANSWVGQCFQNHKICGSQSSNAPLPTRVLDIGTPDCDKVRLYATGGQSGKYVALSYCWGQKQLQRTTTENLAANFDSIDFEALSPTIKDAITVTRSLELRYIWIDALCIIQDSAEDKMKELANMANVYENASITLVAASATGADEEFLKPKPIPKIGPRIPYGDTFQRIGHFNEITSVNHWFQGSELKMIQLAWGLVRPDAWKTGRQPWSKDVETISRHCLDPPHLKRRHLFPYHFTSQLGIFADEDSPAALSEDVIGRKVDQSADSEANIQRTLAWLQTCLSTHPGCVIGTFPSSFETWSLSLPTRLIRIRSDRGSSLSITLYESAANESGAYIALSHCWGRHQIITTTISTIDERKTGIPFSALSKTFQDSIILTHKLGVEYIWIDSLCIIQDSGSDWEQEAARMGTVYQNALLTIAASAASDGQKGCFFPRSQVLSPVEITYNAPIQDGNKGVYIQGRLPYLDEDLDEAPLNKRAWTLQEHLLSKRVLHCCANQLYWECQSTCFSESGLELPPVFGLPKILNEQSPGIDIFKNYQSAHWHWMRLLNVYSKRALTKDFDKLPALSGLAHEFAKQTGDQYLAGLWRQFLPLGLLWEVKDTAVARRVPGRAPSWSWASVEGTLGLCRKSLRNIFFLVDVLEAQTTPLGLDPFGQVRSGIIKLRAKVAGVGYFAPDDTTLIPSADKTALLVLEQDPINSYTKTVEDRDYLVLFVEPVIGKADTYERIGMGCIAASTNFFDHAEYVVVSLV
ncbi:hypothetical protein G7Y89_g6293 [Cudoniella acicularis]|uniref:Heterokaryon incompatibility domain-containing protein n=1 Tax=Cudoniella acicularis TaxID=354080 RepID=A0A8H4W356_9HELO|nr:hypothetical protein G7Y89_g6293 [Cudoniella acicularis]